MCEIASGCYPRKTCQSATLQATVVKPDCAACLWSMTVPVLHLVWLCSFCSSLERPQNGSEREQGSWHPWHRVSWRRHWSKHGRSRILRLPGKSKFGSSTSWAPGSFLLLLGGSADCLKLSRGCLQTSCPVSVTCDSGARWCLLHWHLHSFSAQGSAANAGLITLESRTKPVADKQL